jgi:polyisoprenoid-binding protein YceI
MSNGQPPKASRFVIADGSLLTVSARSSIHQFSYRAPLTGEVEAEVRDGEFDLTTPIAGAIAVDLESLRGDDPRTDGEMHRRLDTQRFPRAKASVQHVAAHGPDTYRLTGELSLHGHTKPMEGDATVTIDGNQLHATGKLTIDLREFGIKPPSLLILRVHPTVEITIDLVATRDES